MGWVCPQCRAENGAYAYRCAGCAAEAPHAWSGGASSPVESDGATAAATVTHAPAAAVAPPAAPAFRPAARVHPRDQGRIPVGWVHLGVGLVLSLVFTLTPTLRFMGWFIGALFHETGHTVFAWFVGCPAFPAISLQGHAAAFHREQSGAICLAIGALLAFGAWHAWQQRFLRGLAFTALALWPFFAFVDGLREVGFLLSGHLGELIFAGVFLWRARTGEQVQLEGERPLYACLGWYLVASNAVLAFGLAFLPSARAWYMGNGSFGLTNDYARVAQEHLHVPLAAVGIFMFLLALAVFPLVLALAWRAPDRRVSSW